MRICKLDLTMKSQRRLLTETQAKTILCSECLADYELDLNKQQLRFQRARIEHLTGLPVLLYPTNAKETQHA